MARTRKEPAIDPATGKTLPDGVTCRGPRQYRARNCVDDSQDQLSCDHPNDPQIYRLAICGGGRIERCLRDWPYVIAATRNKTSSRTWSVLDIDPMTGRLAMPGQAGALRVWAYRGSPVYTHIRDKVPGDMNGHGNGEFGGSRNGFRAFVLRDDFNGGG